MAEYCEESAFFLGKVARPGGLELPTFWFVAVQGQNLSACSGVAYPENQSIFSPSVGQLGQPTTVCLPRTAQRGDTMRRFPRFSKQKPECPRHAGREMRLERCDLPTWRLVSAGDPTERYVWRCREAGCFFVAMKSEEHA